MRKILILSILLMVVLFVSGCGNNITGQTTMDLTKDVINNGDTTTIKINGKNTGKQPIEVVLKITLEDAEKLIVSYAGNLDFTLQPYEDTGTKIIDVQGFTEHSSTKYWIKVQLINKANNEVLDEEVKWLTVNK